MRLLTVVLRVKLSDVKCHWKALEIGHHYSRGKGSQPDLGVRLWVRLFVLTALVYVSARFSAYF